MMKKSILVFIEKLNESFQGAITPESSMTVDESMISSKHANHKGKKNIRRNPRPVGVELKNLADAKTKINLVLEKSEDKSVMSGSVGWKSMVQQRRAPCDSLNHITEQDE